VGVVNFAQFAAVIALAPWAGTAADRYDRRRLMLVAQLVAIAVTTLLALIAAADAATPAIVIVLALVLGTTTAFSTPAMQALVPLLVPPHELMGAMALNSVTFNLARAIGPVVGTVIIAHLGIPAAFGLNAFSYLALVVALLVIHPRPQGARPQGRVRMRDSWVLLKDRRLAMMLLAVAALSVGADSLNTLTPGFATQIFGQPDTMAGVLVGAFGTGAVAAAFFASRPVAVAERRIAVMLAALGGGMVGFALAPTMLVALPLLAIGGFGYLAANTTATTAIQLGVDDHLRGRAMALWSIAFLGVRPIASLIDGALAAINLRLAGVVIALPALIVAAIFARYRPVPREVPLGAPSSG
jgi:MFS family permease